MLLGLARTILSCHLGGKRGALTGAFKAFGTGSGPSHHVADRVGNGDDGIVKRCLNMGDAISNVLFFFFLPDYLLGSSHASSRFTFSG